MSGDIGVGLHETSVVGKSPDKIHNKHAKVSQPPLPRPAAACWWAQTTVEEDGKMEDTAAAAAVAAPEARNSLNSHREQVFLLFLTNPEISEEE